MDQAILADEQYYIQATSGPVDERTRVLKQGDSFAVFDHFGDIRTGGLGEQGIYHQGTRFLSRMGLMLNGSRPLLLSSMVREDNVVLSVDLTNPDIPLGDQSILPRGSLHLNRTQFLWDGVCYGYLRFRNYHLKAAEVRFALRFDADFADIFEVRGQERPRRGQRLDTEYDDHGLVLRYQGLDGVPRRTRVVAVPQPRETVRSEVRFTVHLEPGEEVGYSFAVACQPGSQERRVYSYDEALSLASQKFDRDESEDCSVSTSNAQFDEWLGRSGADLHMLITETGRGPYPYAGVPWFSTEFGRDGIITALEFLWVNPDVAKGVLAYLAHTQAREVIPEQDAEPGKILHETRRGEMAALKEIPFGRYYGSVDSTPLFIILAGAYFHRTADLAFLGSIWQNIELALEWIDRYGDPDQDGFVEYSRKSSTGLVQQGWKDSQDSVFHQNGDLAEGPIALCEVQGYVYAARKSAATMAQALGHEERAAQLRLEAQTLQHQFEGAFWCDDLSTYAIALDGKKRPCRVRSSNAGHCLYAGIASRKHAAAVAEVLMNTQSFSGWGIRTVAAGKARYNPMSYHNGSIWPHDSAIVAAGLARYGYKEAAGKILTGLFDTSIRVDLHRIPELFCGFSRRRGRAPTLYPVACSPQAWASASVFLLLQACLGLQIDAAGKRVFFEGPYLPDSLENVRIRNLQVGTGSVDLTLYRYPRAVGVNVERRRGHVEISVMK